MDGRDEHYDLCVLADFYLGHLAWDSSDPMALTTPTPPTFEQIADALRIPWDRPQEAEDYIERLTSKLLPLLRGPIAAQLRVDGLRDGLSAEGVPDGQLADDMQWFREFNRLNSDDKADVALRLRKQVLRRDMKNITPARAAEFLARLEDRREVDPDFAVALDQEMEGLRNPKAMVQRIQGKLDALQREQQRWLDKL